MTMEWAATEHLKSNVTFEPESFLNSLDCSQVSDRCPLGYLSFISIRHFEPSHEKTFFFKFDIEGADQLRGNRSADQCQQVYFLYPYFRVSSHLPWLYCSVCVGFIEKSCVGFIEKIVMTIDRLNSLSENTVRVYNHLCTSLSNISDYIFCRWGK